MITAVMSGLVYVIGLGFTYVTLTERKNFPEFKAFLLAIVWLPAIIIMMLIFSMEDLFPKFVNRIKDILNRLSI